MPIAAAATVTYTGRDPHPGRRSALTSGGMRGLVRAFVGAIRQAGACGVGVYLGGAIVGLIAVVTGNTRGHGWLPTVPVLIGLGVLVGVLVAVLSRRWLVPTVRHRRWVFAAIGGVSLPLFEAFGDFPALDTVGAPVALAGGAVTAIVYWRASRLARRSRIGASLR